MDTTRLEFDGPFETATNDSINISDVIEVIETDPIYTNQPSSSPRKSNRKKSASPSAAATLLATNKMYNGVDHHIKPKCVLTEEPAQKQLRFRYECEGRSAGSIPGANSTPESKTYPTIQIQGYKGKAIVVVSCVTKDEPYRPHPHKLVGREGCKKGVCTVQVSEETMTVSFQNLGIQCVKKKDIEEALKTREEIRVDPFRTGFSHRNQPASIDLNAVRLCFQVFLQEQRGKYIDLQPIVSTPIYDKKAMCDLIIVKLSDCVCPVDGGNKDLILLCEKVAKEDIQIRFFEEKNNELIWEGYAEFQPSQVHKQTAICFRPPKYKTLDIIEPVKMFIQLKRPSDNATSTPVPFQMVSLGRPTIWSLRPIAKKRNYDIFSEILAKDGQFPSKRPNGSLTSSDISKQTTIKANDVVSVETQTIDCLEVDKVEKMEEETTIERLVDDVAELDAIYALNKKIFETIDEKVQNNNFDDTKSYTSLQLAFKNPLDIVIDEKYEDVVIPPSPIINVIPTPSQEEEEKLPPLPPKRIKKGDNQRSYSSKITDINDPTPNVSLDRNLNSSQTLLSDKMDLTIPPRSQSFSITRPKSQNDLIPPLKDLPPTPCSTLPKQKKRKFLSGLVSYFSKSSNPSRETTPIPRNSLISTRSLAGSSVLNRSASNISQHSSASIHIPLKDPPDNVGDLNQNRIDNSNGNIITSPDNNYDFNLDLTEAEHYALYTALAPHATQSEFDETSCYYAPVEGGKIFTEAELQANKT